ncbi:unnamed protein product [Orchesella dallaii]|uniref:Uncharacterized protein n=1 Tax=Orchesella dallaii TaxID=48710 RepID=A0ABP1Q5R6_9HEXA
MLFSSLQYGREELVINYGDLMNTSEWNDGLKTKEEETGITTGDFPHHTGAEKVDKKSLANGNSRDDGDENTQDDDYSGWRHTDWMQYKKS